MPAGDERTDEELLSASHLDSEAFGVLYDRYERRVLVFFIGRTACAHTAADLAAETFAQALVSRRRFHPGRGSVSQWLFGIARNELSHYLRHRAVEDRARRRLGFVRTDLDDESLVRIEELIDFELLRDDVRTALSGLPSDQAEALRLRIGHDLPYDVVAKRLGCTINTARVRVARGLAALRTSLVVEGGIS